jgi:two-component system response regulator GlrR
MSQKRILLVDDDADQRLSIRLPLEAAGYAVYEAPGYDQGLVAVKEIKPDLIVLDVMMDTTTAGFQYALTLHSPDVDSEYSEFSKTPIIMLTAIHSTTPLRFSPDDDYLPVQTFLEKPVDTKVLLATIHRHLGD